MFSYGSDIIQIKESTATGLFMCESNQEPRSFAECTEITSTSPTLILLTDTSDSCLLVPITKNSVLSSFNINLSLIIHERISALHFSIASSASASHVPSNGRNGKYNWVSSAYECVDGGWDLIRSSGPGSSLALCSQARQFTLSVPLSSQVHKWLPANFHPIQGGAATLLLASY